MKTSLIAITCVLVPLAPLVAACATDADATRGDHAHGPDAAAGGSGALPGTGGSGALPGMGGSGAAEGGGEVALRLDECVLSEDGASCVTTREGAPGECCSQLGIEFDVDRECIAATTSSIIACFGVPEGACGYATLEGCLESDETVYWVPGYWDGHPAALEQSAGLRLCVDDALARSVGNAPSCDE
jgi:hypothetical protein